ncbi:MAG: uracil-DNA glycosylase [Deltaproteobacteria bacterium]|nr:uracil-DNA glycosylase [Deltaproteobacteria bacterium]
MGESGDVREELARLVGDLRRQLAWRQAHGLAGVGASASPRLAPGPEATAAPTPRPSPAEAVQAEVLQPSSSSVDDHAGRLAAVRASLGDCQRCDLAQGRTQIVFGTGNPGAALMFVGEGPGRDEDLQGEPFVGAAGQLLTRMIQAMGLAREEVYIANIVKCRPPGNRNPEPAEIAACEPFLRAQIDAIGPRAIVALGSVAARALLGTSEAISRLRGRWTSFGGIPVMPTFHPAYLLRNPEGKRPVWEDLKQVMAELDRLGVPRRAGG